MSAAGETHTDTGTITVPYNSGNPVVGSLALSAVLTSAINTSGSTARSYVTIANDANIADGTTILSLALGVPVVSLASLVGGVNSNSIDMGNINFNPKGGGVTLTLHFGGATLATLSFSGE